MSRSKLHRKADCHPERPHYARGLCNKCYNHNIKVPQWRRWYNPEKERERKTLKKYGVSLKEYQKLLNAQGGCCNICKGPAGSKSNGAFHIDHDHESGLVRGLLCVNCNHGIGCFMDNPALTFRATLYLIHQGEKPLSWDTIKLADVKPESFPEIPAGEYTFTVLPGATTRTNNFGTEELVVSAAIAEGEQVGRRVFLQYPDPESVNSQTGKKASWSAQALKKLEISLGIEQASGETPVEYLNRAASNGHARFKGTMAPANKIRANETEPRIEFKLFSVAPAA